MECDLIDAASVALFLMVLVYDDECMRDVVVQRYTMYINFTFLA